MICSYECTFCLSCVELLKDVCPNCGGGFTFRPIRPEREWKPGLSLRQKPAVTTVTHKPVDFDAHELFAELIGNIPPEDR